MRWYVADGAFGAVGRRAVFGVLGVIGMLRVVAAQLRVSGDVAGRVCVLRRWARRRSGVQREIGMALNVAHRRLLMRR